MQRKASSALPFKLAKGGRRKLKRITEGVACKQRLLKGPGTRDLGDSATWCILLSKNKEEERAPRGLTPGSCPLVYRGEKRRNMKRRRLSLRSTYP